MCFGLLSALFAINDEIHEHRVNLALEGVHPIVVVLSQLRLIAVLLCRLLSYSKNRLLAVWRVNSCCLSALVFS
jgi:hypothetical protein